MVRAASLSGIEQAGRAQQADALIRRDDAARALAKLSLALVGYFAGRAVHAAA